MKQRLYKRNAKNIAWWEVETYGPVMFKRWAASKDGRVQQRSKDFTHKGKQGRSDVEQAEFMAESEILTQVDQGYVYEPSHTEWAPTNSLGFPMPMLAMPFKDRVADFTSCSVTPKLNGHRMMFATRPCRHKVADSRYPAEDRPMLYSRGSQEIKLPFIFEEAMALCEELGVEALDGELYVHGLPLQEVKSLVASQDERLRWHLYDVMHPGNHEVRRKILDPKHFKGKEFLTHVPTHSISSQEELQALHARYTREGYEGTMLRWGSNPYLPGARPKTLMKVKNFEDQEFEVLDMVFDEPRYDKEGTKLLCPSFIVKNNEGKESSFKVSVHGNMYEKDLIGKQGLYYWKGRVVTISFQERSKNGIPTICTCLGERDDL